MRTYRRTRREPKSASSTENGFESRGQRARAERLGEKIVRAELEDAHLVVLVAFGRQHDDGNVRGRGARAQMRQHAVAVEPREVQVQYDDVRPHAIDLVEGL